MFKFICRFVWASANCHMFSPCPSSIENNSRFKYSYVIYLYIYIYAGCWFQTFVIFTPTWGDNPIRQAYFSDGLGKSHQLDAFRTIICLQASKCPFRILPRGIRGGCDCAFFRHPKKWWFSKGITPKRCRKYSNLPPNVWLLKLLFFSPWKIRTMKPWPRQPPASCSKNIWILFYVGYMAVFSSNNARTRTNWNHWNVCIGCY